MSEEVKQEGTFKIKSKPKQLVKNDIVKVDLSKTKKQEKDAVHSSRRNKEGGCGRTSRK